MAEKQELLENGHFFPFLNRTIHHLSLFLVYFHHHFNGVLRVFVYIFCQT
jgi:hypothetical protein